MECTHLWDALGICQWCKINVRVVVARLTKENKGLKEYSESRDESIKVYREEIKEQSIYIHQLRGALGYPVPGDIPNNPEIVNGIAEALNKLNDDLTQELLQWKKSWEIYEAENAELRERLKLASKMLKMDEWDMEV